MRNNMAFNSQNCFDCNIMSRRGGLIAKFFAGPFQNGTEEEKLRECRRVFKSIALKLNLDGVLSPFRTNILSPWRAEITAFEWTNENVPCGTKILIFGYFGQRCQYLG